MTTSTRTAFAGTATNVTLTAANLNNGPGGLIGWARLTADASTVTTIADIAGLSITLTPGTSRVIRLGWSVPMSPSGTTGEFQIRIQKDGVDLFRGNYTSGDTGAHLGTGFHLDLGPSSTSHTYKVKGGRSGSDANTWTPAASSDAPSWFAIWDDGPSF